MAFARNALTEDDIAAAIEERAAARKDKDFNRADSIRDNFAAKGVCFETLRKVPLGIQKR